MAHDIDSLPLAIKFGSVLGLVFDWFLQLDSQFLGFFCGMLAYSLTLNTGVWESWFIVGLFQLLEGVAETSNPTSNPEIGFDVNLELGQLIPYGKWSILLFNIYLLNSKYLIKGDPPIPWISLVVLVLLSQLGAKNLIIKWYRQWRIKFLTPIVTFHKTLLARHSDMHSDFNLIVVSLQHHSDAPYFV